MMCPARHFAKQEIMIAVAIVLAKYDIELVEWTFMDGTRSEKRAEDNRQFVGAIAMPPDRDMRVRWRKRGLRDSGGGSSSVIGSAACCSAHGEQ